MNRIPINSKLVVTGKQTALNYLVKKSSYSWYCCYITKSTYSYFFEDISNHLLFFVTHLVLHFSEDISAEEKESIVLVINQQVYPYLKWLCIVNGNVRANDIYLLFLEKKIRLKEILLLNEVVDPMYVNQKTLTPIFKQDENRVKQEDESEDLLFFSSDSDDSSKSENSPLEQTTPQEDIGTKEMSEEEKPSENEKDIVSKNEMVSERDAATPNVLSQNSDNMSKEKSEEVENQSEEVKNQSEEVKKQSEEVKKQRDDMNEQSEDVENQSDDMNEQSEEVKKQSDDMKKQSEEVNEQSEEVNEQSDDMNEQSEEVKNQSEEVKKQSEEVKKQSDEVNEQREDTSKQSSEQHTLDCWDHYTTNAQLFIYSATLTSPILYAVADLPDITFSRQDFVFRNMKFQALTFSGKPEFIPINSYAPLKDLTKTNAYVNVKLILNNEAYPIVIRRMSSVDELSKAALLFIRCLKYNEVKRMELILNKSKLESSENGLKIEDHSDIYVITTEKSKPQPWKDIVHSYETDEEIRTAYVPPYLNLPELLQNELLFSVHFLTIHIPVLEDKSPLYVTLCKTPLPYLRELTIFTHFKSSQFHIEYLYSILHTSLSLIRVCGMCLIYSSQVDNDSKVELSNPLNSNASQELNQLTTKMKELQERQASTDSEIRKLEQSYSALRIKLSSLKQSLYSNARNGPVTSLCSALGSLVVHNYYYFFYSYSSNTIVIDIIQSSIKKGSCLYNRTQSIYSRQPRIPRLPEGIFPKVQKPLGSFFIKIVFEYREFLVRITEKMTGAQLYSVVKHSLLADEFINEWDSIVLIYNMNHISPKVTLMSLNMTENSVVQAYRKEGNNPSVQAVKPVIVSLEDSFQQDSFISDLQRKKFANVQHLILLAGFPLFNRIRFRVHIKQPA